MVKLRQFDVFTNPNPGSRRSRPYFVVLQSDQLRSLGTTIVAPLVELSKIEDFKRLNPEVAVGGHKLMILTQELGAFPVQAVKRIVANLDNQRYHIIGALDLLFTGI